jgi:protein TonB
VVLSARSTLEAARHRQVLRGNPLLNDAAVEAVRQWVYTPTLLNGVPVSVLMTVTLTFQLTQPS